MIRLKSEKDIEILREGGKRLSRILTTVAEKVAPGVSTSELDELAEQMIREMGDKPAFKGYRPEGSELSYPASLCTSINDEVVHCIPGPRVLKEGDIIALDLGLNHRERFTDMAITLPVGRVSEDLRAVIDITKEALYAGIREAKAGNRLGDIGATIASLVRKNKYGLVTELCGHGVGFAPHEEPFVPNFGRRGQGERLVPGMVLAIEPMVNLGRGTVRLEDDGFTFKTADGKPSAHFEHTILITEGEPEILTATDKMMYLPANFEEFVQKEINRAPLETAAVPVTINKL